MAIFYPCSYLAVEENLEGKVSLRKKAKPRPMKTIQPSMWLLLIKMVVMTEEMMMMMKEEVKILPNVAGLIVKTQDCAEAFPMTSES